ncbi:MAG: DUF4956 domain-containing protein [Lachnospiraceae bacterium]|nr:DUF4956 domain-containing protein [Lachnospira sp.]MBQ8729807.1 DUF4956 domain-containing protein [Lachnospiraceae bacterium]
MKQDILEMLSKSSTTLSTQEIITNFVVALVLGMVIYISYRTSHTRVTYSRRFNVSLLMLTMVTTLVMSVIGNNIALSLGMVGALSIVRFRTAVKDPRDTAYIFWCIAIGICCGVTEYIIASIGTACIFVLLVLFGLAQDNLRYLLVIRGARQSEAAIIATVKEYYRNKAVLKVNNSTLDTTEFIFEVPQKIVKANKNEENITEVLYKLENITAVNLIAQSDEMR